MSEMIVMVAKAAKEIARLQKEGAQLREGLRIARREIRSMAENGTQKLIDAGVDVDPAEKTYGPIFELIDAALKEPRP